MLRLGALDFILLWLLQLDHPTSSVLFLNYWLLLIALFSYHCVQVFLLQVTCSCFEASIAPSISVTLLATKTCCFWFDVRFVSAAAVMLRPTNYYKNISAFLVSWVSFFHRTVRTATCNPMRGIGWDLIGNILALSHSNVFLVLWMWIGYYPHLSSDGSANTCFEVFFAMLVSNTVGSFFAPEQSPCSFN